MSSVAAPCEADSEFPNEVIEQILRSVDCDKRMKASLGQFLGNVTANANHKHLAYHLFCTVILYVSKHTTLNEEEMSVLCRIIGQLRQEWSSDDASPEKFDEPLCVGTADHDEVSPKHSLEATKHVEGGDVDDFPEVPDHAQIPRPITPIPGFMREAERHTPATPNFHDAMSSKDKADLESQYPFGHRLMTKQGWSNQRGLGPDGSGIQRPIDAYIFAGSFTSSGCPARPGRDPETNGRSIAHKCHSQKVTAWHQYSANPDLGDRIADIHYRGHDTADGTGQIQVDHPTAAPASSSIKSITQDDNQKVIPTHRNKLGTQENASHWVLGKKAKEPSEKTSVFVTHDGTGSEGW
ncbi:hypothetical protein F5Y14DRAFT_178235 [Nemania sp. NC0429]|nr:hypothetical protein F5Y14DRAFT_178235 [Nemania sp. NC0429]